MSFNKYKESEDETCYGHAIPKSEVWSYAAQTPR